MGIRRERGAVILTFRLGPLGFAWAVGHVPTIEG